MDLAAVARLYASNALWRATGARAAGRVLVRGLASCDESVRAVAGTFLVRGGERALPLLAEAVERRDALPTALTVLADIGDPRAGSMLRDFSRDPDPEVARAARDGLEVLGTPGDGPPL